MFFVCPCTKFGFLLVSTKEILVTISVGVYVIGDPGTDRCLVTYFR